MSSARVQDILDSPGDGRSETVRGWVRTKRDGRNVVFLEINDGSCLANIQVVADKESGDADESLLSRILTGAAVTVRGTVVESRGSGQGVELKASGIELTGGAPADYPLQKKRHSFEFLREIAHLRPRTNTFGAVARVRNLLSRAVHDFFQEKGFLWIHTPVITASDAEGAGHLFRVTTLDALDPPRGDSGEADWTKDFFGRKAHLTVSGQLQAENYACSMGRVYTFGPTFRAENSNTARHLSEFWMIEPEAAFCDLDDNRALAEEFIRRLLKTVLEEAGEDMAFFDRWIAPGTIAALQKVLGSPFVHLTYTEASAELEKAKTEWEFPHSWGMDLQAEHERYLTEAVVDGPLVVTDYPKDIKAFYMKANDDGRTVRAMDVLVPRLGEIIGGSQREDDYDRLEGRMRRMGMDTEEYSWYLDIRRYGSVPHSGFGLGFERLVQYVTGMKNIRDVIPFPRAPKTIAF